MRITDRTVVNHTISQLQERRQRLGEAQTRVATGRRIQRSSDNPADAERAMTLGSELRSVQNQLTNLETSQDWLVGTDVALDNFHDLIGTARNFALRAVNDTNSQDELDAIGASVGSLLENALTVANSTQGGYYLLAGHQVRTPPFSYENGTIVYDGDDKEIHHIVEPGQTMAVNIAGNSGANGGILNGLIQLQELQQAITSNDRAGISSFLARSEEISKDLYMSQSTVGARMQRIDQISIRLEDRTISLKQLYSNLVDADMATTIAEMNAENQAYEMTLAASARAMPRSLLDYLR